LQLIASCSLYFRAPCAYEPFFKYLFGRAQYYGELSQIVFECMGLSYVDAWQHHKFDVLRRRAFQFGLQRSIVSLFEAHLFVSRCKSHLKTEEQIRNNLDAFDITDPVLLGYRIAQRSLCKAYFPRMATR
jgi:hypothetical protein